MTKIPEGRKYTTIYRSGVGSDSSEPYDDDTALLFFDEDADYLADEVDDKYDDYGDDDDSASGNRSSLLKDIERYTNALGRETRLFRRVVISIVICLLGYILVRCIQAPKDS